jgi:ribosomal protein S18 acetylase RimI-like enzyme
VNRFKLIPEAHLLLFKEDQVLFLINLQVRSTNAAVIEFYKRLGFKIDDVVRLGKRREPNE